MSKNTKALLLLGLLAVLVVGGVLGLRALLAAKPEEPISLSVTTTAPTTPITTQHAPPPAALYGPWEQYEVPPVPEDMFGNYTTQIMGGTDAALPCESMAEGLFFEGDALYYLGIEGDHYAVYRDDAVTQNTGLRWDSVTAIGYVRHLGYDYVFHADETGQLSVMVIAEDGSTPLDSVPIRSIADHKRLQFRIYEQHIYILARYEPTAFPDNIWHLWDYDMETGQLREDFADHHLAGMEMISLDMDSKGYLCFYLVPEADFVTLLYLNREGLYMGNYGFNQRIGAVHYEMRSYGERTYYVNDHNIVSRTFKGEDEREFMPFGIQIPPTLLETFRGPYGAPIYDLAVGPNGQVALGLYQRQGDGVSRTVYKATRELANTPAEMAYDRELVVTCSFPPTGLVKAANVYMIQNPGTRITFDALYATQAEFYPNWEQTLSVQTARILTGNMGDIFCLGGQMLVYRDILATDAFIDLTARLESDPIYSDLNQADLRAITIGGDLRALPTKVYNACFFYDKVLYDALGLTQDMNNLTAMEMIALAKELEDSPDKTKLLNLPFSTFYSMALNANMPDLIDIEAKTFDLRQDWFYALVEDLKEVAQSGAFPRAETPFSIDSPDGRNVLLNYLQFDGTYNGFAYSLNRSGNRYALVPSVRGEISTNRISYTRNLYGISARSKNQDLAWDFLRFLMTPDGQACFRQEGSFVNTAYEREVMAAISSSEFRESVEAVRQSGDYMYDMSFLKEDLHNPLLYYINGIKTLDEAIAMAEHNLLLRLSE